MYSVEHISNVQNYIVLVIFGVSVNSPLRLCSGGRPTPIRVKRGSRIKWALFAGGSRAACAKKLTCCGQDILAILNLMGKQVESISSLFYSYHL